MDCNRLVSNLLKRITIKLPRDCLLQGYMFVYTYIYIYVYVYVTYMLIM